jgi:hypothetical protein
MSIVYREIAQEEDMMKRVVAWLVLAVFGMVAAGCTIEQC